jgi:metallo-beta-lactamase class B
MKSLITFLLLVSTFSLAQATAEWRSWNQPIEPFRVAGNIYYVGANEITSFLITSPQGHILLDAGFAETAPQIERNIEKLGFHLRDVKVMVNSQAHADHAGGFARLKHVTGARLLIAPGDFDLLVRGGHGDFAFGDSMIYPSIKPDGTFKDGEVIRVGEAMLTAHITPGHTRGCTTWTTRVIEDGKPYDVSFLCSISAPGYRLVNNAAYPNIVDDFHSTFRRLHAMHTDIFLAAHGSAFHLEEKRRAIANGKANPFIAPAEWNEYLDRSESAFNDELKKQQAAAATK